VKVQPHIDAQEILEKYDKENQFRTKIGKWAWVVTFLGVALTIFHLYTGYFGTLPSQKQGAVHLGTALGIIFLLYPANSGLNPAFFIIGMVKDPVETVLPTELPETVP